MKRAAILGASGYGGGELIRLLGGHPGSFEVQAASRRFSGQPVSGVHPNLRGIADFRFVESVDWNWLAEGETPVLFSAMPHGELARQYAKLSTMFEQAGLAGSLTVVDLSADFRISDADLYESHYGSPHPLPRELSNWRYGAPEFGRKLLSGAKRIANPGCFATALQLGVWPLRNLPIEGLVAASGVTGSSGSGTSPSDTTHHPTRSNDFRAYKVLAHQHMAEVAQLAKGFGFEVSFVPHSAPMVRGILVTLQFLLTQEADVRAVFEADYRHAPFVRFVEGSPRVAAVVGSNFADIGIVQNGRHVAVLVALDNLLKGMSGQAVQNMNLALGFDETAGLWFAGGYPY